MGQVQYDVPPAQEENFSFPNIMRAVRADGFFMADNLYLRHESIIGACMDKVQDNVIPFPTPNQPLNS